MSLTSSYIACALWSSTDDQSNPLDMLDLELSDNAKETLNNDISKFVVHCLEANLLPLSELDLAQFAHDFWLTRNGHGAGFWDRGLGKLGDDLTAAAQSFGECNLYVSDDNQIEVE